MTYVVALLSNKFHIIWTPVDLAYPDACFVSTHGCVVERGVFSYTVKTGWYLFQLVVAMLSS